MTKIKDLISAITQYKLDQIQALIAALTPGDINNSSGKPLLYIAAQYGNKNVVKALIDKGVDINATYYDATALHVASCEGHEEVVELLLNNGIEVNAQDNDGQTALTLAFNLGYTTIMKSLIDKGATHPEDNLIWSCITGNEKAVMQHLKTEDVNTKDPKGKTPLIWAVLMGHTAVVDLLLQKDPGLINKTDDKGETALHVASCEGHTAVADLLLQKDPGLINKTDRNGYTALHVAADRGIQQLWTCCSKRTLALLIRQTTKAKQFYI